MVGLNTTWNVRDNDGLQVSPRWVEVMGAVWMFLVMVFGVLENVLILYVFARNKQFINNNNIPVIAMLFNCLCMSVLGSPLPFIAELSGNWYVYLSNPLCTFEAFIVYLFGMASLYLLLDITLWRYVTITNPMGTTRLTNKHAVIGVLLSYALAAMFALCPLLGFGAYGLEAHGTSCGLAWDDRSTTGRTYLIVILVGCFLLPVSLMVVCYTSIFKVVKKASILPSDNAVSMRYRRQQQKERKLLKLSILMVSTFLACWTPYAIVSFYTTFGEPGDLHPLVTRIPALLAKSEVLCNPIIYTLQTRQFRHQLYRTIPIRWLREKLERLDDATTTHDTGMSANKEMSASTSTRRKTSIRKSASKTVFIVGDEQRPGTG